MKARWRWSRQCTQDLHRLSCELWGLLNFDYYLQPSQLQAPMSLTALSSVENGCGAQDSCLAVMGLLLMKGGFLKWKYCWMGRESWHAIREPFNRWFLTLKSNKDLRHPAINIKWVWGVVIARIPPKFVYCDASVCLCLRMAEAGEDQPKRCYCGFWG